MTDPLGQSQVLPYIIGLSKHGFKFHLLSFEKVDRYKSHREYVSEICETNGIEWHPQDYQLKGGLKKTLRQVRRLNKVTDYLQQRHHFDAIHCRSYISALSGVRLKKKYNIPFVFDMRGFWADERVDAGLWNLSSPIYRAIYHYFKRKEAQFLVEASYTVSLTENGREEILSWKKTPKDLNIKVIPCCVDLELFDPSKLDPAEQLQLREQLHISEEAYVLGYVGSIGTWYMLSEMLDYFKSLLANLPSAVFLFVTREAKEMLTTEAEKKGIPPEKIYVTSTLHNGVPKHIALFNSSIFFIRPTYSKKASSPTKQGEIMAMGIPLVCNSGIGDTDYIVKKYRSGIVLDEFTEASYAENRIDQFQLNADEIKDGARSYFSLEEGVKKYLQIYNSIIND